MDLLELKHQGSKIMNLEAKKKEYQKVLVEEYRKVIWKKLKVYPMKK